jgi:hypothetical protein
MDSMVNEAKLAGTIDPITRVAQSIAQGPPPEWLARGLAHFSAGIGAGPADEY